MTAMVTSRLDHSATPENVPDSRDSTVRRMSKIATTNARENSAARTSFCDVCSWRPQIMKRGKMMTVRCQIV